MQTTASNSRADVEEEIEKLRQHVIAARNSGECGPESEECVKRLNLLYEQQRDLFTPEDVRFLNVLRGSLGSRLEAHEPVVAHTKKLKRKGDKLDHCWRCLTSIDERFTEMCPKCSEKAYQWRVCPVCQACGCQRAGNVLI